MAGVDPVLHALLCALLAFVLLRAAWHKGRDLAAFRRALADYALLPSSWVAGAALALAALEATTAIALWLPATAPAAARATGGLLGLYSLAIAINRSARVRCRRSTSSR
jgi:hypothetical protein